MGKKNIVIVLMAILYACHSPKKDTNNENFAEELSNYKIEHNSVVIKNHLPEIKLRGKIILSKEPIVDKEQLYFFNEKLLIFGGKGSIHLYDVRKQKFLGEIKDFLGNGEDRIQYLTSIFHVSDTLFLYSDWDGKFIYLDYSKDREENIVSRNFKKYNFSTQEIFKNTIAGVQPLNDSTFISPLVYGKEGRFVLYTKSDSLATFGNFPELPLLPKDSFDLFTYHVKILNTIYGMNFSLNLYNGKLITFYDIHLLEMFDLFEKKLETQILGPINDYPIVAVDTASSGVYLPSDLQSAYRQVQFSEKYMFCNYFGSELKDKRWLPSKKILVFDHEGNFRLSILPERPFHFFVLNEKDNKLYTMDIGNGNELFTKYDLDQITELE